MLTGSDLFDGSVIEEIEAMYATKVLGADELLRLATKTTLQAMFPERRIGIFAEGAETSLVAYDADPTRDLAVLRAPRFAIKQGEMLAR